VDYGLILQKGRGSLQSGWDFLALELFLMEKPHGPSPWAVDCTGMSGSRVYCRLNRG
jgi:hypothetical protein